MAETWRRVWGDGKLFREPRFLNDVFSEKISIFTAKISDDLFLVIDQVFRIFPFFSQIVRIFYYVKCRIWPIPHKYNHYFRKEFLYDTFFYSVRTFARIRQHFSRYWGADAWAVSPPQIFGEPSSQFPLGLRPWGFVCIKFGRIFFNLGFYNSITFITKGLNLWNPINKLMPMKMFRCYHRQKLVRPHVYCSMELQ